MRILSSSQAQNLSGKVMVTMLKPDPGLSSVKDSCMQEAFSTDPLEGVDEASAFLWGPLMC